MWVLVQVSGKQGARVHTEGGHLSANIFIRGSVCELGFDLIEKISDVGEELVGDVGVKGVFGGILLI